MNMSDTERTKPVIESMGYVWTDHEDEADLVGNFGLFGAAKSHR